MDRTIINPLEQMRDFDFVQGAHDVLVGLGGLAQSVLSGASTATVSGLVPTQTVSASLTVNIAAGSIYVLAQADATSDGSIPIDTTLIVQQGLNAGQAVTLAAPSSGQSQWNLIQCQFSQADSVRAGDPNGGTVPFYNAANPTIPNENSINTVRRGLCIIQVITGSAATTGSEIPPQPSSGWTPLYLIDLAGGQTQVTTSQILKAGPSVGTGVPSNYPGAPLLAGLLAQHHTGVPGQAPKIVLTSSAEVQGVLPYINMSPVRQLLSGALGLFVNGSTGNDTNSGLSPSVPFKTIQAAANTALRNYDFNGQGCSINVANGTYTGTTTFFNQPLGLNSSIFITGNTASPGSVTITSTLGSCFIATNSVEIAVNGFTLVATGTAVSQGYGIISQNGSAVIYNNIVFGACAASNVVCSNGSQLQQVGPVTISGNTPSHITSITGGLFTSASVTTTLTGTPAFSLGFAAAGACGVIQSSLCTFTGAATGPRFLVNQNGVINTSAGGANYFPGNSVGVSATGGQYL